MIKASLIDSSSGNSLTIGSDFGGNPALMTESFLKLSAKWKTIASTAVGTFDLVTPIHGRSLFITDLIVTSSKKVALSTVKVQFSDGIRMIPIVELEGASEPISFSHSFVGGLMGWINAGIQVVLDQPAMSITTLVGYVNIRESGTKSYNVWNAER